MARRAADENGGPFYTIYDVTSSGLNQTGVADEPNRLRVAGDSVYNQPNFGLIEVDWSQEDPAIKLEIHDVDGKVVREVQTTLNTLKPCQL
jgi:alkaline phosphatase D